MVAFLILLFFAILFLIVGGVLLYFRNRTKHKSAFMSQTETSNASDVSGIAPGTLVEVKGTLRCEEPLASEMAERTCAYYSSRVTREYLRPDYDDTDVGSDRRKGTPLRRQPPLRRNPRPKPRQDRPLAGRGRHRIPRPRRRLAGHRPSHP